MLIQSRVEVDAYMRQLLCRQNIRRVESTWSYECHFKDVPVSTINLFAFP